MLLFSSGEKRPITGAWLLDEDRDLAVLQISTGINPYIPLPMATALPERTDAVVALATRKASLLPRARGLSRQHIARIRSLNHTATS